MSKFDSKMYGVLVASDFKYKRYKLLYWFMFTILVIVSIVCIVPTVWVVFSAFKTVEEMNRIPPTFFPENFQLSKVKEVWEDMSFGVHFKNSLSIILGSLVFCIGANGLAGYAISRLKPAGSQFYGKLVFWSMLMPSAGSMVITFAGFVEVPILGISLINTHIPMWLQAGANAFYVLLFKSYFDSIDRAYMEAARIDGCSDIGIFFRIIVPLSVPLITTITIFTVNASWGSFLWPSLIIKDGDLQPVAQVVSGMRNGATEDKYMMALLIMMIVPITIFLLFKKKIMGGFNLGGIKG